MSTSAGVQRVVLQPDAQGWAQLAHDAWAHRSEDALRFRSQVGLPTDRPIIMTGHQPGFWHPGILAKYIAADRLARQVHGAAAAVIVDHDAKQPTVIDMPVQSAGGSWAAQSVDLSSERAAPDTPTTYAKRSALAHEMLVAATGTSVARVAQTNVQLLSPWFQCSDFDAGAILATDFGRQLLDGARTDAHAMASAYNDALSRWNVGIPRLTIESGQRVELPLWWIDRSGERRRAWSDDQTEQTESRLAPRALLLTALLRMVGCDLFVHGTGGGVYDQATSAWIGTWLGRDLAPMVVASADVLLPLEHAGPGRAEAARATWQAHRAPHDPSLLGEMERSATKHAMLREIEGTRDAGARRAIYERMHVELAAYRTAHAAQLEALSRQAADTQRAAKRADVAERRDWPAMLYAPEVLEELASRIEAALASSAAPADV
ncbi:MAG: hypothetical protein KDA20_04445 [Phycisphaerales bacterium]|nr:hypothetical protein [Phycisphaerales bacterium]